MKNEKQDILRIANGDVEIIASSRELVALSISNPNKFGSILAAKVSKNWPIQNLVEGAPWVIEQMRPVQAEIGYWIWWVLHVQRGNKEIVGYVGFKGLPTSSGKVEITFAIDPACRNQKIGSRAAEMLVGWASKQRSIKWIVADTKPTNEASKKLLTRVGFKMDLDASCDSELIFVKRF